MEITIIQVILFILGSAIVTLSYCSYNRTPERIAIPALFFCGASMLFTISAVDPKTLKEFVWKQNTDGSEFRFIRHTPSAAEVSKVLLDAETRTSQNAAEIAPILEEAKTRNSEQKSASDYLLLSTESWRKKDYNHALSYAYLGLALKPEDPRIEAALEQRIGTTVAYINPISFQEKKYEKAIELAPEFSNAYNSLGIIKMQYGETEEALELYKQAVKLDPRNITPYLNISALYVNQNEPDKALEWNQTAVDLAPEDSRVYTHLGKTYEGLGRMQDAEEAYKTALSKDPNDRFAIDSLSHLEEAEKQQAPR